MKVTKRTVKAIVNKYNVDITTLTTIKELVKALEAVTYKVVMEADLCDRTVHYIEDVNGDIVVFITDEIDTEKIVAISLE